MLKITTLVLSSAILFAIFAIDPVAVNTPQEWSTIRGAGVISTVVLDTAKLSKQKLNFTLTLIKNGKKRIVASKRISGSILSDSLIFLPKTEKIVGGENFYSLAWKGSSSDISSELEPVGTAPNSLLDTSNLFTVSSQPFKPVVLGSFEFSMKADMKTLTIELSKSPKDGKITFALDPANKKTAFGTFADRFIEYDSKTDSLNAYYCKRSLKDSKISYSEKKWLCQIDKSTSDGKAVLKLNWTDLGIKVFDGRRLGVAVFTTDNKSLPASANIHTPATWSNILIKK